MEATGSPGSIGADVPPIAAHMQPVPDDGLGMTPTAEILSQLVQNSRVTTNAISQLALVQQEASASASTSAPGAYEGTLSKALEGAVKMLGRPPLFGGGKTEVYDFMDFKEQLYNILAYAEPKYTDAFRSLEKLGDDEGVPERFTNEEHQVMSTRVIFLVELMVNWNHEAACTRPKYCYIKEWLRLVEIVTQNLPAKYKKPKFGTHAGYSQLPEFFTWSELNCSDLQT